eukprot:s332_g9.t1
MTSLCRRILQDTVTPCVGARKIVENLLGNRWWDDAFRTLQLLSDRFSSEHVSLIQSDPVDDPEADRLLQLMCGVILLLLVCAMLAMFVVTDEMRPAPCHLALRTHR